VWVVRQTGRRRPLDSAEKIISTKNLHRSLFRILDLSISARGVVNDSYVEVCKKNLDRSCFGDELTSGQFVLVNEAVNLGIAIYNMRQGESIRYETLLARSTCACCAGLWILADFTKSSSFATRHSFGIRLHTAPPECE
jgi:hypothetical protein